MRKQRVTVIYEVECTVPDFFLLPWDKMTKEQRGALTLTNCAGHGTMSQWCEGCKYGRIIDDWIENVEDI